MRGACVRGYRKGLCGLSSMSEGWVGGQMKTGQRGDDCGRCTEGTASGAEVRG